VVPFAPDMVVSRAQATLQFRPPAAEGERTLKVNTNQNLIILGSNQVMLSTKLDNFVLESLKPDAQGTAVRLTVGRSELTQEFMGAKGAAAGRGGPPLPDALPADLRGERQQRGQAALAAEPGHRPAGLPE